MKVILNENVANLGKPGDIIDVKPGFAMNYLIPKKIAVDASDKNAKVITHKKKMLEHKLAKLKKDAEKSVGSIEALSCTIARKSGENEKLFGSVTSKDIEEYLRNEGFKIDKKEIVLGEPIKALGIYTVPIKLFSGVEAKLKVWVVSDEKKEDSKE